MLAKCMNCSPRYAISRPRSSANCVRMCARFISATRACGNASAFPDLRRKVVVTRTSINRKAKSTMKAHSELLPAARAFLAKPARMLIDGQWREAASGEALASPDPATGETLAMFPAGGQADADEAVGAVLARFPHGRRSRRTIAAGFCTKPLR